MHNSTSALLKALDRPSPALGPIQVQPCMALFRIIDIRSHRPGPTSAKSRIMSSTSHSSGSTEPSPSITALRRCQECGQAQDAEHRLQRCAGCFIILYCSKTCQKKDWKTHK